MAKPTDSGGATEPPPDDVIVDTLPRAVIAVDAAGRVRRWNRTAETLFGWSAEEVLGRRTDDFLVPSHEASAAIDARARLAAGETVSGDFTLLHRDGRPLRIGVVNRALFDVDGTYLGIVGLSEDVSQQRALEEATIAAAATERLARERLEFLTEINDALATATTPHEAMRNVAQASVPRLGDWCSIYVLPDNGSRRPDIEVAHTDPELLSVALDFQDLVPYDPAADAMIPRVIRTGTTEFYRELDADLIALSATPTEVGAMVEALGLRSVIGTPLVKRDRVLGAIQFVNGRESRTYTDDDVVLAEIVAGRVASTLDNLRLHEHAQMIARTLQASLLPESLPHVPGIDVAVRYWATGEGTEVGGDFYDVFDLGGSTAVVMGDVCGTGPMAASTTGLARHTIRASAWHGGGPHEILGELNGAMLRSGRSTFCTVSYATLTPTSDGIEFEVASGGHPLPVVCRADGSTSAVGNPGTLIGMLEEITVRPERTVLAPGDTVVFHTDGVTDVRPPHDIDPAQLQALVRESCRDAGSADEVADALRRHIEAVLPLSSRDDDIALLVLRVSG